MATWCGDLEAHIELAFLCDSRTDHDDIVGHSVSAYQKRWCRSDTSHKVRRDLLRRLTSFVY